MVVSTADGVPPDSHFKPPVVCSVWQHECARNAVMATWAIGGVAKAEQLWLRLRKAASRAKCTAHLVKRFSSLICPSTWKTALQQMLCRKTCRILWLLQDPWPVMLGVSGALPNGCSTSTLLLYVVGGRSESSARSVGPCRRQRKPHSTVATPRLCMHSHMLLILSALVLCGEKCCTWRPCYPSPATCPANRMFGFERVPSAFVILIFFMGRARFSSSQPPRFSLRRSAAAQMFASHCAQKLFLQTDTHSSRKGTSTQVERSACSPSPWCSFSASLAPQILMSPTASSSHSHVPPGPPFSGYLGERAPRRHILCCPPPPQVNCNGGLSSTSTEFLQRSVRPSDSGSFSHGEPWSPSSSVLFVHWYGQFTPIRPCSPQWKQYRGSLLPLPLPLPFPLAFVSIGSFICHRANQVCCPWSPSDLLSFLHRLFCHASIHQPLFLGTTSLLRLVLSCLLTCLLCTISKRSHTRLRATCRCPCSSHSVSSSHRTYRHFPGPLALVRRRSIISLMMISSFSMISSNHLGPLRNSRLVSSSIISVTTNVFCAQ